MLALKATVIAASGLVATWFTALAPEPADAVFFLMSRGSGKCIQPEGSTRDNGDRIVQGSCAGGQNVKLRKIDHDDGSFYLQFAHSKKCLNLTGASLEEILLGVAWPNGAALAQWDCADREEARWRSRTASDGYVFLTSEASHKCINLNGGTKSDGAAITQWDCAKRPDMMWKMVPAK
jgi:hypothetical protein